MRSLLMALLLGAMFVLPASGCFVRHHHHGRHGHVRQAPHRHGRVHDRGRSRGRRGSVHDRGRRIGHDRGRGNPHRDR